MSHDATIPLSRRGNGYTEIPNQVPRDESISLDARGFLCLIMTISDKSEFNRSNLMKICGIGTEKYHRITRELKDAGYLTIQNIHGETGRISGTNWIINQAPGDGQ